VAIAAGRVCRRVAKTNAGKRFHLATCHRGSYEKKRACGEQKFEALAGVRLSTIHWIFLQISPSHMGYPFPV
jgi:hypothetical protein